MLTRLILFLIRRKLGLRLNEDFRFDNQRSSTNYYYITREVVMKYDSITGVILPSNVSINWLLSKRCEITKKKEVIDIYD